MVSGRYKIAALATADDHADADGETVLNWSQAQAAVRAWATKQTSAGPLTVAGACAVYVEDLRARKGEKAAIGARNRLQKHLVPRLGSRRVADLTEDDVRRWRNSLVAGSDDMEVVRRSRDTANRLLGIAKAVFNLAFDSGRVPDDRSWRRVKSFRGVGEARKIILDDDELQRLIDACGHGLRELCLVGAWTGARLGELTARRARDFDSERATLSVSGKTGPRVIHLPPPAVALLRQLASGKGADGHLFTDEAGERWIGNRHTRRFAAAVTEAGLDFRATFYSLRHSYISRALVAGVPIKAVADHCGTSAAMIERFYAKWVVTDQQRYAAMAAPLLRIDASEKVVSIRPGAA